MADNCNCRSKGRSHTGRARYLQFEGECEGLVCLRHIIVTHGDEDGPVGLRGPEEGGCWYGLKIPRVLPLQLGPQNKETAPKQGLFTSVTMLFLLLSGQ